MCLVGDDECTVDAGLVGVLGKAARCLYCVEEPVPFRGQGLDTRIHHLAGDVYDDFRRGGGGGEDYFKGAGVTASKRHREKSED